MDVIFLKIIKLHYLYFFNPTRTIIYTRHWLYNADYINHLVLSNMTFRNSSLFFLLVLSSFLTFSVFANTEKKSSVEFLKHLEGGKRGNNIKGIRELKLYLQHLGYLSSKISNDDEFDGSLESALKTYQHNFHLKGTGVLDSTTLSNMAIPRCGVADIINGTNIMVSRSPNSNFHLHIVSRYAFFPDRNRWPPSKRNLTFAYLQRNYPIYINIYINMFC